MFEVEAPPLSVAEIVDDPDQAAACLAADRPGPDAVAAISMLDPATLSHAGRIDLLVALERQQAWLAARQQRVLAAMADHADSAADPLDRTGTSWVREDVACALRLSALTAQSRLHTATDLAHRLPRTLRMLDHGAITYLHARALTDAVTALDPKTATEVETRVLAKASEQTLANFKASVRRAVATTTPATIAAQRHHAMTERRVCLSAREDGMSELWALLPAEGAAAVMTAVDALTSATPASDTRTADQRRADALVDLAITALHDPLLPKAHRMRPAVQVTHRPVHPARPRQPTRRTRPARTHPRPARPPHRRRPHRHLAPPDHRPHRQTARLRHHHLPPTRRPHPIRDGKRSDLHLPRLSQTR